MKEVKKKTDRFDPARLAQIELLLNRLDNYKILFDGEDRYLIQEALEVHKNLIEIFEREKE